MAHFLFTISRRIYADLALLRHCDFNDQWQNIARCWQCVLFARGEVIHHKISKAYYIVLGDIQATMLLVWMLLRVPLGATNHAYYVIARGCGGGEDFNAKHILLDALNLADFQVVPCVTVSPVHFWLALKKKAARHMGIVLLQNGPLENVMKYAARQCFHKLSLEQVKNICAEERIHLEGVPTLASTLTALIKHFLAPKSDDEVLGILALRAVEPDNPMEVLTEDVAEEMLDSMDLQTLAEQLKKVAAKRAEAKAFRDSISAGNAGVSSSSGGSHGAQGHGQTKVAHKINLHSAKNLKPPHSVLFHCHLTKRIRGYYCFGGARPSRGCVLAHGQDTARKVVLKWLWHMHKQSRPHVQVPYEFVFEGDEVDEGLAKSNPSNRRRGLRIAGSNIGGAGSASQAAAGSAAAVPAVSAPSQAQASSSRAASSSAVGVSHQPEAKKKRRKGSSH